MPVSPSPASKVGALWCLGSVLTKGCGHANDETFARGELLGQIDLIARGTFDEVDIGDRITDFDHVEGCLMEGSDRFIC